MKRIRPELVKGVSVLILFLMLTITISIIHPIPISQSEYKHVDLDRVSLSPLLFDELNISSSAIVESVIVIWPIAHVITTEEVDLQIRLSVSEPLPELTQDNRISFRGTVHAINESLFIVQIHEFRVLDSSSSIIRSIPGIVLFVVMFFVVYTIDFKRLAFVPRRKTNA
jgi:hypothetical protein